MERFRVWNIINGKTKFVPVPSPKQGSVVIKRLTYQQLLDPLVVSNVFGLEELEEDGKWHEWYDKDGNDVDAAFKLT